MILFLESLHTEYNGYITWIPILEFLDNWCITHAAMTGQNLTYENRVQNAKLKEMR
jgi:hypothetical protein